MKQEHCEIIDDIVLGWLVAHTQFMIDGPAHRGILEAAMEGSARIMELASEGKNLTDEEMVSTISLPLERWHSQNVTSRMHLKLHSEAYNLLSIEIRDTIKQIWKQTDANGNSLKS